MLPPVAADCLATHSVNPLIWLLPCLRLCHRYSLTFCRFGGDYHWSFCPSPFRLHSLIKGAKRLILLSVSPGFGTLVDAWDVMRMVEASGFSRLQGIKLLVDDGSPSSHGGSRYRVLPVG